ncbi:MAG: cytosine permease [Clostridiales Family XIII bacterium]|jgi:putative hydroxymethylpyrimidine transporter CytX|nr:cytosine permease [Clostridiales Family XIII bacterium]
MKKTTMLLLWMGAAVSISEIFTGGLLAPLGFGKGFAAILTGHLIGVALLAFGGRVSFARGENAMGAVALSFGVTGGKLVALCNLAQLIGWTVVMIVQAGSAMTRVLPQLPFAPAILALSALVLAWALLLGSPAVRLNNVAVVLLLLLCAALLAEAVGRGAVASGAHSGDAMGMALAIELSVAMPVSWLPLIGDYTVSAEDRVCATLVPFAGYFTGSTLMYLFGLFIARATGGDIFTFVAASRFRYLACGVVLLSTLTTAFLDLYSAAASAGRIAGPKGKRAPILAMGLFAALVSTIFPVERYGAFLEQFLTSIGMVFIPVYTILFLDFLMNRPASESALRADKLFIALAGMIAYRLFGRFAVGIPTVLCVASVTAVYVPYSVAANGRALS